MERYFTITELTSAFEVSTRTLRYYEDEGLIAPRRRGRQRLYSQADRTRIKLILRGRRLGFSLAEIREIIDMYGETPGEAGQLNLLVAKIEARRAELIAKRDDIDLTLRELDSVEAGCKDRLSALSGKAHHDSI